MFEKLRAYIERKTQLTEEQYDLMRSLFIPKKMKKGEFLHRSGEIAKYGAFVVQGCLRSYVIDVRGKEHIVLFAPEEWWIGDMHSGLHKVPSQYFIDAIEPSEVLLIDLPSHQKIIEAVPAYAAQYQLGLQKHMASKDKRIVASLSTSAEDRYLDFLKTYPSIALRVPQHMLASYLGITPETLSRLRKQKR